jgi:hypothetical protein
MMLRSIQQPSHIDGLLNSLVQRIGVVPEYADPVEDRSDLPSQLQKVVSAAIKAGQSWLAWAEGGLHYWLFVAEMSLPLSRERGSPVLQLKCYRERGLKETSIWFIDREAKWHRCTD